MRYDDYVAAPDENDLRKIARLGQEFVLVSREIEERKRELEIIEKRFKDISEVELPEAMKLVNLAEFKLTTGYRIVIEDVFNVRLPKQNIDKADEWLAEHGHGGMIKRKLQIDITADDTRLDEIKELAESYEFEYEEVKTVHWSTLQSWANEMKAEGEMIPEEIFNVYRGNRTVITE